MRFHAVLNRDGGTLRSVDLDRFCSQTLAPLRQAGHRLDIDIVSSDGLEKALADAAGSEADVVLAGGGDGTISAAAGKLMGTGKVLAVLPAGTMNMFARSLGIPLSLPAAVQAFADGRVRLVDVASANDRPFVYQLSVGMHAEMVAIREGMEFASRLGKLRASTRAALATVLWPKTLRVSLMIGGTEILVRTTSLGITNNLFGEGHLPYADDPAGGVLGVYVTVARERGEVLRFLLGLARGRWRDNPHVEIHEAERVVLRLRSRRRNPRCVIDGELLPLAAETNVRIHKQALAVLVPAQ